jgi:phosphoribosylformimino-5-aminoimidazole carboxamide ribotide isomerase
MNALCQEYGERVVFSLDLKDAMPLCDATCWNSADTWAIAAQVIAGGVRTIIVLDLAHVGAYRGAGALRLCARLVKSYPHVDIVAGGGVRNREDLVQLRDVGVKAVLVASAFHDEHLNRDDLAAL